MLERLVRKAAREVWQRRHVIAFPQWAVYDALVVNPDETRAAKIVGLLGLDVAKRGTDY
jgi:hypothetical protein